MLNIRKRREELGLSQKQLSDLSGVSVSLISKLERGEREITERSAFLLEEAFEHAITPTYVLHTLADVFTTGKAHLCFMNGAPVGNDAPEWGSGRGAHVGWLDSGFVYLKYDDFRNVIGLSRMQYDEFLLELERKGILLPNRRGSKLVSVRLRDSAGTRVNVLRFSVRLFVMALRDKPIKKQTGLTEHQKKLWAETTAKFVEKVKKGELKIDLGAIINEDQKVE